MKFKDLLDEDGQGSRQCDAWLAENIENREFKDWKGPAIKSERKKYQSPNFTTGDSIDPIWELAKEYFTRPILETHFEPDNLDMVFSVIGEYYKDQERKTVYTSRRETEQLAIAEALFKAYQKENVISTEEAVEKYDDPENSFPLEGDE